MKDDIVVGKIVFDGNLFNQITALSKKSIEHEKDKQLLEAIKALDKCKMFTIEKRTTFSGDRYYYRVLWCDDEDIFEKGADNLYDLLKK